MIRGGPRSRCLRATEQAFDLVFGVKLRGAVFTVQRALPLMRELKGRESGSMCCGPASLFELQKNEPKRLKSLSRAHNRALRETVDSPRDSESHC